MKITLKEIAAIAGVSTTTVSKILNKKDQKLSEATRQRVLKIADEYNYIPNSLARSMVTKRTRTLGLIVPDITNPFFPEIARGVEDKANEEDYNIILCNTDNDIEKEERNISMLIEKMVDGIIILPSSKRTTDFNSLKNILMPIVLVDRDVDIKNVQAKVLVDNYDGSYNAVKYLLDEGYRKIAFITGPLTSVTALQRLKGYKHALDEYNVKFDESYILEGSFRRSWGREAVKILIEEKKSFDAVFCGNDLIAISTMKTIKEYGYKVPEQIGVLGYDDIYISEMVEPPLSTVRQPKYLMGYKAAQITINAIEKKSTKGEIALLKTELIVREST